MKRMIMVILTMVMLSGMPVMAKEAEVPEEEKQYTFSEIVEEIESYDAEEEEVEKISTVSKRVDYGAENYTLVITYKEPTEEGYEWISIIVENGMIEVQAKGDGIMVLGEYTYRQFMEQ